MVARQKDVKAFFKKLRKRYPNNPAVLSRDRKILEHIVFAIFLENTTFKRARTAFVELQRYFIDWNEIRVSTANEIASVVNDVLDPVRVGERLRRFLQWIFDKTYKFELEDFRAKEREEFLEFLGTIPYSTSFMNDYAALFSLGGSVIPLDEISMRVLRLLGYVSVVDGKEVVPCLDGAFKENEAREFFFALHEFAVELNDEETNQEALDFLLEFDSSVSKRSAEPLVESTVPSDPREIARLVSRRERRSKNGAPTTSKILASDIDDDYDEKQEDGLFEYDSDSSKGKEADGSRNGASEEAYITSSSTSYVDNRLNAGEKTKKTKERKTTRSSSKRTSQDDTATPSRSKKSTSSKAEKSEIKASDDAESGSGVKKSTISRSSKTKKKSEVSSSEVCLSETETEKSVSSPEEPVAAKPRKKATRKKTVKTDDEQSSEKTVPATKEEDSGKSSKAVPVKKTAKKASLKSSKEQGADSEGSAVKKVKKSASATRVKKAVKKASNDPAKGAETERTSVPESAPSVKGTVKAVKRVRKTSSEPPDSSNVEVKKKTTKRSAKSSKGTKTSKSP